MVGMVVGVAVVMQGYIERAVQGGIEGVRQGVLPDLPPDPEMEEMKKQYGPWRTVATEDRATDIVSFVQESQAPDPTLTTDADELSKIIGSAVTVTDDQLATLTSDISAISTQTPVTDIKNSLIGVFYPTVANPEKDLTDDQKKWLDSQSQAIYNGIVASGPQVNVITTQTDTQITGFNKTFNYFLTQPYGPYTDFLHYDDETNLLSLEDLIKKIGVDDDYAKQLRQKMEGLLKEGKAEEVLQEMRQELKKWKERFPKELEGDSPEMARYLGDLRDIGEIVGDVKIYDEDGLILITELDRDRDGKADTTVTFIVEDLVDKAQMVEDLLEALDFYAALKEAMKSQPDFYQGLDDHARKRLLEDFRALKKLLEDLGYAISEQDAQELEELLSAKQEETGGGFFAQFNQRWGRVKRGLREYQDLYLGPSNPGMDEDVKNKKQKDQKQSPDGRKLSKLKLALKDEEQEKLRQEFWKKLLPPDVERSKESMKKIKDEEVMPVPGYAPESQKKLSEKDNLSVDKLNEWLKLNKESDFPIQAEGKIFSRIGKLPESYISYKRERPLSGKDLDKYTERLESLIQEFREKMQKIAKRLKEKQTDSASGLAGELEGILKDLQAVDSKEGPVEMAASDLDAIAGKLEKQIERLDPHKRTQPGAAGEDESIWVSSEGRSHADEAAKLVKESREVLKATEKFEKLKSALRELMKAYRSSRRPLISEHLFLSNLDEELKKDAAEKLEEAFRALNTYPHDNPETVLAQQGVDLEEVDNVVDEQLKRLDTYREQAETAGLGDEESIWLSSELRSHADKAREFVADSRKSSDARVKLEKLKSAIRELMKAYELSEQQLVRDDEALSVLNQEIESVDERLEEIATPLTSQQRLQRLEEIDARLTLVAAAVKDELKERGEGSAALEAVQDEFGVEGLLDTSEQIVIESAKELQAGEVLQSGKKKENLDPEERIKRIKQAAAKLDAIYNKKLNNRKQGVEGLAKELYKEYQQAAEQITKDLYESAKNLEKQMGLGRRPTSQRERAVNRGVGGLEDRASVRPSSKAQQHGDNAQKLLEESRSLSKTKEKLEKLKSAQQGLVKAYEAWKQNRGSALKDSAAADKEMEQLNQLLREISKAEAVSGHVDQALTLLEEARTAKDATQKRQKMEQVTAELESAYGRLIGDATKELGQAAKDLMDQNQEDDHAQNALKLLQESRELTRTDDKLNKLKEVVGELNQAYEAWGGKVQNEEMSVAEVAIQTLSESGLGLSQDARERLDDASTSLDKAKGAKTQGEQRRYLGQALSELEAAYHLWEQGILQDLGESKDALKKYDAVWDKHEWIGQLEDALGLLKGTGGGPENRAEKLQASAKRLEKAYQKVLEKQWQAIAKAANELKRRKDLSKEEDSHVAKVLEWLKEAASTEDLKQQYESLKQAADELEAGYEAAGKNLERTLDQTASLTAEGLRARENLLPKELQKDVEKALSVIEDVETLSKERATLGRFQQEQEKASRAASGASEATAKGQQAIDRFGAPAETLKKANETQALEWSSHADGDLVEDMMAETQVEITSKRNFRAFVLEDPTKPGAEPTAAEQEDKDKIDKLRQEKEQTLNELSTSFAVLPLLDGSSMGQMRIDKTSSVISEAVRGFQEKGIVLEHAEDIKGKAKEAHDKLMKAKLSKADPKADPTTAEAFIQEAVAALNEAYTLLKKDVEAYYDKQIAQIEGTNPQKQRAENLKAQAFQEKMKSLPAAEMVKMEDLHGKRRLGVTHFDVSAGQISDAKLQKMIGAVRFQKGGYMSPFDRRVYDLENISGALPAHQFIALLLLKALGDSQEGPARDQRYEWAARILMNPSDEKHVEGILNEAGIKDPAKRRRVTSGIERLLKDTRVLIAANDPVFKEVDALLAKEKPNLDDSKRQTLTQKLISASTRSDQMSILKSTGIGISEKRSQELLNEIDGFVRESAIEEDKEDEHPFVHPEAQELETALENPAFNLSNDKEARHELTKKLFRYAYGDDSLSKQLTESGITDPTLQKVVIAQVNKGLQKAKDRLIKEDAGALTDPMSKVMSELVKQKEDEERNDLTARLITEPQKAPARLTEAGITDSKKQDAIITAAARSKKSLFHYYDEAVKRRGQLGALWIAGVTESQVISLSQGRGPGFSGRIQVPQVSGGRPQPGTSPSLKDSSGFSHEPRSRRTRPPRVIPQPVEINYQKLFDEAVKDMKSSDPNVRVNAVKSLHMVAMKDPKKALKPLLEALKDSDEKVRSEAASRFYLFGRSEDSAQEAITGLSDLLNDKTLDPKLRKEVRKEVTPLLDQLRRIDTFGKAIEDLYSSEDPNARLNAVKGLKAIAAYDPKKVLDGLVKALKDSDAAVRAEAAKGFDVIFGRSEDLKTEAIASLESLVEERKEVKPLLDRLRRIDPATAASAFAGSSVDTRPEADRRTAGILVEALEDRDAGVSLAAATTLRGMGSVTVAPLLELAADPSKPEEVREKAFTLLVQIGMIDAGLSETPTLDALIEALSDPRSSIQEVVMDVLSQIGEPVVGKLIHVLSHSKVETRIKAAEALGWIGSDIGLDAKAIDGLIQGLQDHDPGVRAQVAAALGAMGSARSLEGKVIDAIVAGLGDTDTEVRAKAAEALGRVSGRNSLDDRAIQALAGALKDSDSNVRDSTQQALGIVGKPAIGTLIGFLQDSDEDVQKRVGDVLTQIGHPAVASLLDALKQSPSVQARRHALALIAKISGATDSREAVPGMIEALKDADASVRTGAIAFLGGIKANEAVDTLRRMVTGDSDATVRASAAEALGKIGNKEAVPSLIEALSDPDTRVRATATSVLGRLIDRQAIKTLKASGDRRVIPALVEALRSDSSPAVRAEAAKVLGSLATTDDTEAVNALLEAMGDQDPTISVAAQEAWPNLTLPKSTPQPPTAESNQTQLPPLQETLKQTLHQHPDPQMRAQAVADLGRLRGAQAVGDLIQALGDDSRMVREQAVGALVKIGPASVGSLIEALHSGDALVWASAVEALGQMGESAIGPLIQALGSEDVAVSSGATWALMDIGKPAIGSLSRALAGGDARSRIAAAWVLAEIGEPGDQRQAVYALREMMLDPNVEIAVAAGDVLREIEGAGSSWLASIAAAVVLRRGNEIHIDLDGDARQDRRVLSEIRKLKTSDADDRAKAAKDLGDIKDEAAVPALVSSLLHDGSAKVRAASAKALGEIVIGKGMVVVLLDAMINDPDKDVRKSAEKAMADVGNALSKIPAIPRLRSDGGPWSEGWSKPIRWTSGAVGKVVGSKTGRAIVEGVAEVAIGADAWANHGRPQKGATPLRRAALHAVLGHFMSQVREAELDDQTTQTPGSKPTMSGSSPVTPDSQTPTDLTPATAHLSPDTSPQHTAISIRQTFDSEPTMSDLALAADDSQTPTDAVTSPLTTHRPEPASTNAPDVTTPTAEVRLSDKAAHLEPRALGQSESGTVKMIQTEVNDTLNAMGTEGSNRQQRIAVLASLMGTRPEVRSAMKQALSSGSAKKRMEALEVYGMAGTDDSLVIQKIQNMSRADPKGPVKFIAVQVDARLRGQRSLSNLRAAASSTRERDSQVSGVATQILKSHEEGPTAIGRDGFALRSPDDTNPLSVTDMGFVNPPRREQVLPSDMKNVSTRMGSLNDHLENLKTEGRPRDASIAALKIMASSPSSGSIVRDRLTQALKSGNAKARAAAAEVLGSVGAQEAAYELINRLGDHDPQARSAVVTALGQIGQVATGQVKEDIVRALRGVLGKDLNTTGYTQPARRAAPVRSGDALMVGRTGGIPSSQAASESTRISKGAYIRRFGTAKGYRGETSPSQSAASALDRMGESSTPNLSPSTAHLSPHTSRQTAHSTQHTEKTQTSVDGSSASRSSSSMTHDTSHMTQTLGADRRGGRYHRPQHTSRDDRFPSDSSGQDAWMTGAIGRTNRLPGSSSGSETTPKPSLGAHIRKYGTAKGYEGDSPSPFYRYQKTADRRPQVSDSKPASGSGVTSDERRSASTPHPRSNGYQRQIQENRYAMIRGAAAYGLDRMGESPTAIVNGVVTRPPSDRSGISQRDKLLLSGAAKGLRLREGVVPGMRVVRPSWLKLTVEENVKALSNERVRAEGIEALVAIGNGEAIDQLREFLMEKRGNAYERAAAIIALGGIGPKVTEYERQSYDGRKNGRTIVQELIKAQEDADPRVQEAAKWAYGRITGSITDSGYGIVPSDERAEFVDSWKVRSSSVPARPGDDVTHAPPTRTPRVRWNSDDTTSTGSWKVKLDPQDVPNLPRNSTPREPGDSKKPTWIRGSQPEDQKTGPVKGLHEQIPQRSQDYRVPQRRSSQTSDEQQNTSLAPLTPRTPPAVIMIKPKPAGIVIEEGKIWSEDIRHDPPGDSGGTDSPSSQQTQSPRYNSRNGIQIYHPEEDSRPGLYPAQISGLALEEIKIAEAPTSDSKSTIPDSSLVTRDSHSMTPDTANMTRTSVVDDEQSSTSPLSPDTLGLRSVQSAIRNSQSEIMTMPPIIDSKDTLDVDHPALPVVVTGVTEPFVPREEVLPHPPLAVQSQKPTTLTPRKSPSSPTQVSTPTQGLSFHMNADAKTSYEKGLEQAGKGQTSAAIDSLLRAAQQASQQTKQPAAALGKIFFALAELSKKRGDTTSAAGFYQKAADAGRQALQDQEIERDPWVIEAHFQAAKMLTDAGEPGEAQKYRDKAEELAHPKQPDPSTSQLSPPTLRQHTADRRPQTKKILTPVTSGSGGSSQVSGKASNVFPTPSDRHGLKSAGVGQTSGPRVHDVAVGTVVVKKAESTGPPSLPPSYKPTHLLIQEDLYSPDLMTYTKAYQTLVKEGDLSVAKQLLEALPGTENQWIRTEGGKPISRDERIRDVLSGLARKDPETRQWLVDVISDHPSPSPEARATAIRVLGDIKHTETIPSLIASMNHDFSEQVRIRAVIALSEFTSSSEVRKALFEALTEHKDYVLDIIGDQLPGFIGYHLSMDERSDITRHMLELIKHEDPRLRDTAIDVLTKLGSISTDERSDIAKNMLEVIKHENPQVRVAVIHVLTNLGSISTPIEGDSQILPALTQALNDPDSNVKIAAIQGLVKLGSLPSLERGGDSQILPALTQALNDPDSEVKNAVLDGLGQIIGGVGPSDTSLARVNFENYTNALDRGDMSSERLVNLLIRAEKLQIHRPYRLAPEDLETVIQMRETHPSDKRPLAVYIHPTSDWNGSFNNHYTTPLSDLLKHGYRVMYYEVSTDAEMVQALKDATDNGKDPAQLLVIGGHATMDILAFGAQDPSSYEIKDRALYLDLTDEPRLKQAGVPSMLARGCSIVIIGCSAGKGERKAANLPNMLRRVIPHAARNGIWSPKVDITKTMFEFDKHNRFKGVMYSRDMRLNLDGREGSYETWVYPYRAYSGKKDPQSPSLGEVASDSITSLAPEQKSTPLSKVAPSSSMDDSTAMLVAQEPALGYEPLSQGKNPDQAPEKPVKGFSLIPPPVSAREGKIPALIRDLGNVMNPELQSNAASQLVQMRQESILPLLKVVRSPREPLYIRIKAAETLGMMQEPLGEQAITILTGIASNPKQDITLRSQIFKTLASLKEPLPKSAIRSLGRVAVSGTYFYLEAMDILATTNDPITESMFQQILSHHSLGTERKILVIDSLGRVSRGDKKTIELLLKSFAPGTSGEQDSTVRLHAVQALGQIARRRQRPYEVLQHMTGPLLDEDVEVRREAVRVLSQFSDPGIVRSLMARFHNDTDPGVRYNAAEGIAQISKKTTNPQEILSYIAAFLPKERVQELNRSQQPLDLLVKQMKGEVVTPLLQDITSTFGSKRAYASKILNQLDVESYLQSDGTGIDSTHGSMGQVILTQIQQAKKLGIDMPFRFSRSTLAYLLDERMNARPDSRPLAVVIFPKADWNDAFYYEEKLIRQLIDHGYRVMYYEVSSDEEMVSSLRDATANGKHPAQFLMIGGHATKDFLSFSAPDPARAVVADEVRALDLSDEDQLKTARFSSMLSSQCSIVLNGCSTGAGRKAMDNLPNLLRRVVPQAIPQGIWSSTIPLRDTDLIFDDKDQFKGVRFDVGEANTYRAYSGGRIIDPARTQVPSHYIVTMAADRFSQKDQASLDRVSQGSDSDLVTSLRTVLRENLDPTVRAKAAVALGETGTSQAFDPLMEALNDAHPLVRQEAAKALAVIPLPRTETVLRSSDQVQKKQPPEVNPNDMPGT